ncbi:hypothetical protein [Novosphingobium sp.]|uniref:hypothetical protein n=1 Tax=Novosphingobium sp. TaxID=1874826 RepID=UPI002736BDC2|nr:hypothetical protein [Novosphingobium sp.]MDP3906643.1 hypothetical protein [Novosphingobium sp.]
MSADLIARGLAAKTREQALKSANTMALIRAVRENGGFVQPSSNLAADNTPTIVLGTNAAVSSINGAAARTAMVPRSDARLTYVSGIPMQSGTTYPRDAYFTSRGAYYGAASAGGAALRATSYFAYEFVHTGTVFEIPIYGGGGGAGVNLRIQVNGAVAGTASIPNSTGGLYYVRIEFPVAGKRQIRVETSGLGCNGVHVASSAEISSTGKIYPIVTMIGDSFLEGSGSETGDIGATVMARALGFNAAVAGVGATGLINPGNTNTAGFPKVSFTDTVRLQDLTLAGVSSAHTATSTAPRLGLVFGSVNDNALAAAVYNPFGSTLQAAINNRAHAIIDAWLAACAGRPLVLFGPIWPSGAPNNRPPPDIYRIRDGLAEAAWSRSGQNIWFIDRLTMPRREGVYSTASDQASLYTGGAAGTDPTHPTPAGHRHDGLQDAAQLRRLILTELA